MTAGLQCYMCKVPVMCRNGNFSKIKEHLQVVHKVDNEMGYLLAGFFMTDDERKAVKDLVAGKSGISLTEEDKLEDVSFDTSENFNMTSMPVKVELLESEFESEPIVQNSAPVIKKSRRSAPGSTRLTEDDSPTKTSVKKEFVSRKFSKFDDDPVIVGPDEKPGQGRVCRVCGKKLSDTMNMRRHFKDVHQPGEYPCQVCGKIYTSPNKVYSHYKRYCKQKTSSGESEYPCNVCGLVLKSRWFLENHRQKCQKSISMNKGVEAPSKTLSAVEEEDDDPLVTPSDIDEAFTEIKIEVDPLSS